jgi:hypothetical protein
LTNKLLCISKTATIRGNIRIDVEKATGLDELTDQNKDYLSIEISYFGQAFTKKEQLLIQKPLSDFR